MQNCISQHTLKQCIISVILYMLLTICIPPTKKQQHNNNKLQQQQKNTHFPNSNIFLAIIECAADTNIKAASAMLHMPQTSISFHLQLTHTLSKWFARFSQCVSQYARRDWDWQVSASHVLSVARAFGPAILSWKKIRPATHFGFGFIDGCTVGLKTVQFD